MHNADDVLWFKSEFAAQIEEAVRGTAINVDLVTAIACQETGYIWQILLKRNFSRDRVLELCVGDTLDASGGRLAFPRNKAALLAAQNGQEMFAIARRALEDIAQYVDGYRSAASNPEKFC